MMVQENGSTKCFICLREKPVPLPLQMPAFSEKRESQPTAGEQQVRGHLEKRDIFRLVGLDGSCWGGWQSWQTWDHYRKTAVGGGPQWMKKGWHFTCLEGTFYLSWKKARRSICATIGRSASPHGLERLWEYILISKHAKNKKTVRNSQHGI